MTKLKMARESKGLSQNKLADLTGISNRSIQKYETGERDINKAQGIMLYKIAQVLDVNIEDLLELDGGNEND